jgi:protein-S-isoprenylcysteine O-methyltransferase Ste14
MSIHVLRADVAPEPNTSASSGAIAMPPLIYIAALAVGLGLQVLLPSTSVPSFLRWSLGGALLLGGLVLSALFFATFQRARTPVDLRKPTTTIATTGPYRLTRNPGYLSLALIYGGIVILGGALWALAPLIPALILVDRAVIRPEERYLESRFGEEYLLYKAQTRRWI